MTTSFELELDSTGVVLIDVQDAFLSLMNDHHRDGATKGLARLVDGVRALDLPIVATQHQPEQFGSTPAFLGPYPPEVEMVKKHYISAMRVPEFAHALRRTGRKTWVATGLLAHACLLHTTLDMLKAGYTVWVPSDATGARDGATLSQALRLLERAGANVAPVETILLGLVEGADHPAWPTILELAHR